MHSIWPRIIRQTFLKVQNPEGCEEEIVKLSSVSKAIRGLWFLLYEKQGHWMVSSYWVISLNRRVTWYTYVIYVFVSFWRVKAGSLLAMNSTVQEKDEGGFLIQLSMPRKNIINKGYNVSSFKISLSAQAMSLCWLEQCPSTPRLRVQSKARTHTRRNRWMCK